MTPPPDVTALLDEWSRGNHRALDQLLPLVYARVAPHRPARSFVGSGPATRCNRRRSSTKPTCDSSINARSIGGTARTSLVSPHRSCAGSWSTAPVVTTRTSGATVSSVCPSIRPQKPAAPDEISVLALDHALERLETVDRGLAHIVELRAFGGLTIEEAAHVLKVSASTAKREWRTAKAWLTRELGPEGRRMTDARWQQVKALFQATVDTAARPSAPRFWRPRPVATKSCVVKSSRC